MTQTASVQTIDRMTGSGSVVLPDQPQHIVAASSSTCAPIVIP